jgi:diguanylate cyclase (GGDEF)-like protein
MNYAFLPDLSALTILIVLLLLLRQQHRQEQVDIWLLGLFFTLVESCAHIFYAQNVLPNKVLHVIVVDCYVLAGLVFTWASGERALSRRVRLLYISLNALPLLAMNTLYGLHIYKEMVYFPCIAAGLLIGGISSLYLRKSWLLAGLHVCGWLALGLLVHRGKYREAVYWSLSCVYTIAALNFMHRLPRKSTGRLAILIGFFIWALCFLVHPWIVTFRAYADIVSHVWNMQKSLISIGMILVMLEEQVSNNEWLALHDELTGLPNRRSFEDRLACALERSRRMNGNLALFMLDLNGFKEINDSLGHQAGDQVLRDISRNLRENVKTFDTLARLGGDEFTLIASDLKGDESVEHLRKAICSAVEQPLLVDGREMVVTASLGIAIYPEDGQDATRLLWVADQRMYRLKQRPLLQQPKIKGDLNSDLNSDLRPNPSL